jgi:nucleotide-binding universal stress UspA family protein
MSLSVPTATDRGNRGANPMPIRKLVVPVGATEAGRQALDAAFAVGHALAAHVEVVHVRPDPQDSIPLLGEGVSGAMVEELIILTEKEAAVRAATAKQHFEESRLRWGIALAHVPSLAGPSTRWMEIVGRENDVTITQGRLADLIVVGRLQSEVDSSAAATLNAALFESGRPVLVVPDTPPREIGKRIAIAWNGSAESARSVSAALDFFKKAQSVLVLSATSEPRAADASAGVIDFLAWHGVSAVAETLPDGGGSVGKAVLGAASAARVDLLVMGAYTHSRLRQLILGGVTHDVLAQARLPLLMAH